VASGDIDIRMIGDKELERKFLALSSEKTQARILRLGMRKAAERIKNYTLINLSGRLVDEDTGRLVNAIESEKPTQFKDRAVFVAGVKLPEPSKLGIPKTEGTKKPGYYPAVLEYGSAKRGLAPRAPFRRAIDEHRAAELQRLGVDIGKAVERAAAKK